MARKEQDAVEVTSAARSRAEEQSVRQRRYLISMSLRTVCFVGAVAVGPGVLRWVLVAGAVFLPYIAVVLANIQGTLNPGRPQDVEGDLSRTALPPALDDRRDESGPSTVTGTVVGTVTEERHGGPRGTEAAEDRPRGAGEPPRWRDAG